ncbi:Glycolipid transfer protein domain [Trinorchestia longiramus]|nr:Glycolipid transfer protein domain [Trinorchestia longiramus]
MGSKKVSPNETVNSEKENIKLSDEKMISPEIKNGHKVEKALNNSKSKNFFTAPERVAFPAPVNGDINSEEFLAAVDDYIIFFHNFGLLFKFAINETNTFMKIIRRFYEENKETCKTIGNMLACAKRKGDAELSLVLLWLKRGVEFYYAFLKELHDNICLPVRQQQETSVLASVAYGKSLKNYHGFMAINAVKVAMKTLPYRATVVKQLCHDAHADERALYEAAMKHIRHLPRVVQTIDDIFDRLQLDTSSRG